jgi:hypothetical protein
VTDGGGEWDYPVVIAAVSALSGTSAADFPQIINNSKVTTDSVKQTLVDAIPFVISVLCVSEMGTN